jgi:hypothetical protein
MRTVRTVLSFVILKSLWITVEAHAEILSTEGDKVTVSQLFDGMAISLSEKARSLPIAPNRRVTIYHKMDEFNKEFPLFRNSLYVDAIALQRLYKVYGEVVKEQFGEEESLDTNTLVQTVFYYLCKDNGLHLDEKYFSDEYFKVHYTYSDDKTFEAMRKLAEHLGKSPTSREWRQHRHLVDGPSESYIVSRFGSFNKAKELANLKTINSPGGKRG